MQLEKWLKSTKAKAAEGYRLKYEVEQQLREVQQRLATSSTHRTQRATQLESVLEQQSLQVDGVAPPETRQEPNRGTGKLFCWTLATPGTYEVDLLPTAIQTLQQCDAFRVYSNTTEYVTALDGTMVATTKAFDGPMVASKGRKWGEALVTSIFKKVYEHMKREDFEPYDWIVKVDPDTAWLPSRFRSVVEQYNHLSKLALGTKQVPQRKHPGAFSVSVDGALYALTSSAMQAFVHEQHLCDRIDISDKGEDWYTTLCLRKLGVRIAIEPTLSIKLQNIMRNSSGALIHTAVNVFKKYHLAPEIEVCNLEMFVAYHPLKSAQDLKDCLKSTGVK